MERVHIDGIALEYEVSGSGEPVAFIHGALIADPFRPLLAEPSLASRHQLISYHRRGYAGSTHTLGPGTIEQQAADCRALLAYLGLALAHVVGHSYGGSVALQLALDFPNVVQSLALLEPALFGPVTGQAYWDALAQSERRYQEAGAAIAVDEFLRARWPEYRDHLEQVLPGAFAQAVADAETWFGQDSPGLRNWSFGEAEMRQITQPVLALLGGESDGLSPRFGETHRLLLTWLPQAEGLVLPGATHFPQAENPRGMAEALAAFYARHPLPAGPLDMPD